MLREYDAAQQVPSYYIETMGTRTALQKHIHRLPQAHGPPEAYLTSTNPIIIAYAGQHFSPPLTRRNGPA